MENTEQVHELKAVLVADVEGYTRLMAAHENEAHALTSACLNLFKELIYEHQGKLIKTTGDGAMIEFSSAISAVQYGINVQKRLQAYNSSVPEDRRPHFRIGVHLGEIIREGGDIYGHSVNVAARLEQFADPDGVCVSEVVYDLVRRSLPVGFECIGSRKLKNVGAPVTIYKVRESMDTAVRAPTVRKSEYALTLPDRPSIAVLPFANRSKSDEMDFFADGVSEDIITCLSKFEELFVIARNSSFLYKEMKVPTEQIAQDLGVRYILEGSVRLAGERMRVSAQLIDCASGHQLWAERYDRRFEDIFDVQDDVTKVIVTTLAGRLKVAESERRNELETQSLNAYSDLLNGRELLLKFTAEDNARAKELFASSIEHDPAYAPACAAMARARNYDWQFSWGEDSESGLDQALEWANKAVGLDRTSARAHAELGFNLLFSKKLDRAISEFRTALEFNPNDCDVMAELSDALTYNGEMDDAIKLLEQAMRLNPYYPDSYLWYLADAYYALRRYGEVIESLDRMTNPTIGCRLFAASYAQLGDKANAETYAQQVLMMQPDFSVNDWVCKQPEINPAETEHLAEGLLKAGLPA